MRVIKRLYSHLVAGAEKAAPAVIPNGEREISQQVFNTIFLPYAPGAQDQFHIRNIDIHVPSTGSQIRHEFLTRIDAGIGNNPYLPVKTQWLVLVCRFVRRLEQRVSETGSLAAPGVPGVGAAERNSLHHLGEYGAVYGRAIQIHEAGKTTHEGLTSAAWFRISFTSERMASRTDGSSSNRRG